MKFSASEENYIKSIYHLQADHKEVTATMLSALVQTRAASVTDMLKKLQSKRIVHYEPYKSFTLTEAGNKIALDIVRKHRLWEYFLVKILGFNWNEVHGIAEELEHIDNKELIQRLDNYLGNPSMDPHGDPIPDSKGKIKVIRQESLSNIPVNNQVSVSSIKDQSEKMLDLLLHYKISIGTRLRVLKHFDFDGSVEIRIARQPSTIISKQVASNIYCLV